MDERRIVSQELGASGDELGIFMASAVSFDTRSFVHGIRQAERLWNTDRIPAIGAFSDPPEEADLAGLELDAGDIESLRRCRPGNCELKLSAAEMTAVREALDAVPEERRREVAQQAFRRVLVARVRTYLVSGLNGAPPYEDKEEPVSLQQAYRAVATRMPALESAEPRLSAYLRDYPNRPAAGVSSRLIWLKTTSTPKPTVQVLHVVLDEQADGSAGPRAVAVWRLVYASHYINAWVSLSALVRSEDGRRYLVYVNRSKVDGLDGWLGGLKRYFVERRVRASAEALFALQRRRLEQWEVGESAPRGPGSRGGPTDGMSSRRHEMPRAGAVRSGG